jgi:hypothetical protein
MRHLVYIGIAAGTLLVGVSAYVWRKRSHCPTNAEMADILLAIDSGSTGKNEAAAMAVRFDAQGCDNAAQAVRSLLAKKYPGAVALGAAAALASYWPENDTKCLTTISNLSRATRPNPTGGSPLPSYYEITMAAAHGSDPRVLRNVADLLDSAAASLGKAVYTNAANCLRTRADTLDATKPTIVYTGPPTSERPAAAPSLMATLGYNRSIPSRFAAFARARVPRPPVRST